MYVAKFHDIITERGQIYILCSKCYQFRSPCQNTQDIHPILNSWMSQNQLYPFLVYPVYILNTSLDLFVGPKDLSALGFSWTLQFELFLRCLCKYFVSGGQCCYFNRVHVTSYSKRDNSKMLGLRISLYSETFWYTFS